ncbi:MAG TPA: P-loop NTPase [Bacilli bacterium]
MSNDQAVEGIKPKQSRGEMIAVCSAKGGVGRTVLAVNLAVALSKNNIQISIVDGNFQFGDVCLAMDLHPTFSIKDVVEGIDTIDQHALSNYLIHHSSGVKVLAAPDRPEYADLVTAPVIDKVCDLLLAQHDYLIVDTGVGLQDRSLQIIEKADQIFILTNLEMATIKNTKMMLETLELLGLRNKVQVIVNRSTMESVIQASDVPDILGDDTAVFIPNQFQLVSQSLNIGIPFVMNHAKTDLAKAVFKLAEHMISRREITLFKPKAPSFLQSIFIRTVKT